LQIKVQAVVVPRIHQVVMEEVVHRLNHQVVPVVEAIHPSNNQVVVHRLNHLEVMVAVPVIEVVHPLNNQVVMKEVVHQQPIKSKIKQANMLIKLVKVNYFVKVPVKFIMFLFSCQ
jgi:hypothetical protein